MAGCALDGLQLQERRQQLRDSPHRRRNPEKRLVHASPHSPRIAQVRVGTKIGGPDSTIEADETWVGGKSTTCTKSAACAISLSGAHHGKAVVMGMLDREQRTIRAKVVPDVKRETLETELLNNVNHGTKVYTDSAPAYDLIHWRYIHDFVNHAEKYVDGQVHTNGLENFWSLFKRNLRGTYVSVEPFHMFRYLMSKFSASTIEAARRIQLPILNASTVRYRRSSASALPLPKSLARTVRRLSRPWRGKRGPKKIRVCL